MQDKRGKKPKRLWEGVVTNDLENKLNEIEKLCDNAMNPGPWDYKALCLVSKESMKLTKALRLGIAGLEMAADDASFEGDKELEEAFWNRIKEIQQIMCGGWDE